MTYASDALNLGASHNNSHETAPRTWDDAECSQLSENPCKWYRGFFISMRKSALAAQLRVHFAKRGYPLEEMFKRSDDTVIGMIAGRRDWCGELHVYSEKLDQLNCRQLGREALPQFMER